MAWKQRTAKCGDFTDTLIPHNNFNPEQYGTSFVLNGWLHNIRDMGGLIFIDLRDRYGIMQLVIETENTPQLAERAKELRSEFVIWAEGQLRLRSNPNPNIPTGYLEIVLSDFGIINKAELPPFEIVDDLDTNEELKLRYRYLDLRRPALQRNFMLRNKVYQVMHQYFGEQGFLEVETPVLMKSTPEGARDFLVPSRLHKGEFYALPQSPQIFKQILMMSGFDKYMQIVKCFRDEDLRADRQPEFTQLDMEMSFVKQEDVLNVTEGLFVRLWKEILNIDIPTPFAKMTYEEAMCRFGSDKPDIRFALEIVDISDVVKNAEFKVFQDVLANEDGRVALICVKGAGHYSRKQLDNLTAYAKKYGALGLAYIKYAEGEISSPIAKFMKPEEMDAIKDAANAEDGDLVLISSAEKYRCYTILGALRLEMARQLGIIEKLKNTFSFHYVVDFPMFEYDEEEERFIAMHHPFTSPKIEDVSLMDVNPGKVKANAYDLVVNGAELGGGSIRIHDSEIQSKVFNLLGLSEEDKQAKFGFLLQALRFGCPPHGGIALGLDRIVMTLAGTENIRDVIAFPKTTSGASLMDDSPSEVDEKQLTELGLSLLKK